MKVFLVPERKVKLNSNDSLKVQLLIILMEMGISSLSDGELSLLILCSEEGNGASVSISSLADKAYKNYHFKTAQSARNAIGKLISKGLLIKGRINAKISTKFCVSLHEDIQKHLSNYDGNQLLTYKILSVKNESQTS